MNICGSLLSMVEMNLVVFLIIDQTLKIKISIIRWYFTKIYTQVTILVVDGPMFAHSHWIFNLIVFNKLVLRIFNML